MQNPVRFGIIGGGWRAEFFTRIAAALPEKFALSGVLLRDPTKAEAFAKAWNTTAYPDLDALAATKPDFVILSVKAEAHVEYLTAIHKLGLPVLCETPAALDVPAMLAIWKRVEDGLKVHIAEQYLFQPLHASRLAVIAEGRLGRITSARVSTAHGYHGTSLIRKFLGIGFEDATISGRQFESPVVEGPGRFGPPKAEKLVPATQLLGEFDFGDRLGIFDFTNVQYWSYVRSHQVTIRGERGQIADLDVRWLKDFRTPVHNTFTRNDRGHYGDLDGYYLDGITCGDGYTFRNPYPYARLMDDEIAIAIALEKMGELARGEGPGPYSFAEGAQDQYLSLLLSEAAKTGEVVKSTRQAWAE